MQETKNSQKISSSIVPFELLDAEKYHEALLEHIPRAKVRVVLVAMAFLWGPHVDAIILAIEKAAQRGVQIHIVLDSFTLKTIAHHHLPGGERRVRLAKTFEQLKLLETSGVRVSRFGKVGFNPYKGRCHVKLTVIDNQCFSFGGVNFTDESFTFSDFMLHAQSGELADCLEQLADRIAKQKPPLANGEVVIDSESSILFDGGRPKDSIIYDRACGLAAQASQIYYASQMVPSGRLGELMRRKPSELYYNRPNQLPTPASWSQAFDEQKHRLQSVYKGKNYIHAKFILFEMPNGERTCITGSNNFSYRGVVYGTQEIALLSTNRDIWDALYKFLRRHIA